MNGLDNFDTKGKSPEELKSTIDKIDLMLERMQKELEKPIPAPKKDTVAIDRDVKQKLVASFITIVALMMSLVLFTRAYFVANSSSDHNRIVSGGMDVSLFDTTDAPDAPGLPDVPGHPDGPDDAGATLAILPGYAVEKKVYVKNNGSYPVYVRARVDSHVNLSDEFEGREGEIDYSLVIFDIDHENWQEKDGYYYFKDSITRGQSTTNFMSEVKFSEQMGNLYRDSTITVTVTLEVVQAANNGDSALEADGWTSVSKGGKG